MQYLSTLLSRIKVKGSRAGFTMIELLIVISILGILAVAVLSAINPVEQINRGRDTGTRSDAEQLVSGIDRYNAFQGYFPWQQDANDTNALTLLLSQVKDNTTDFGVSNVADCTVLKRLSTGVAGLAGCAGSQELKESFVTRVDKNSRHLYAYNHGKQGDSTYICFVPQSGAFVTEATKRCESGLPADLTDMNDEICSGAGSSTAGNRTIITEGASPAICLP